MVVAGQGELKAGKELVKQLLCSRTLFQAGVTANVGWFILSGPLCDVFV